MDRIASVINDFNPLAFASLALQLEELAQQTASQAADAGPLNTASANATAANAPQPNGAGSQAHQQQSTPASAVATNSNNNALRKGKAAGR